MDEFSTDRGPQNGQIEPHTLNNEAILDLKEHIMSVPLAELFSWNRLKRYREEAIHFLTQNAAILRGGHNVGSQVWGCVLGLLHGFCDRLVYYDRRGSGTFQSDASGFPGHEPPLE